MLSGNGNMMTNMTGSSILKSTAYTDQVNPVNLSVRFILGEREPYRENLSDSEQSKGISDSEVGWESCVSSVKEEECFYDVVSLVNSLDIFYYSFPTRSLSSIFETKLDGLATSCRQPSKSDQVPVLNGKVYLMQKS